MKVIQYNEVPRYIQALFVHDLVWKLKDDKLLPFHYETNDFNNAMARIKPPIHELHPLPSYIQVILQMLTYGICYYKL